MALTPEEVARQQRMAQRSRLEDDLMFELEQCRIPLLPVRQYEFCPGRKFRFDFAWPEKKIAVEVDGGTWTGGRHVRGAGFARDREKDNLANRLGWLVLHYTTEMVKSGRACREIAEVLGGHPPRSSEPKPIRREPDQEKLF